MKSSYTYLVIKLIELAVYAFVISTILSAYGFYIEEDILYFGITGIASLILLSVAIQIGKLATLVVIDEYDRKFIYISRDKDEKK